MFNNSRLAASVRLAFTVGAATAALTVPNISFSQETAEDTYEKITVTGSAINRIQLEGALPVDVLTIQDIKRSGVTSVPDLVANIPSMQGFISEGESVGGTGGGVSSASLRDLGSEYTLVLLNGRRMASSDSGGTIDLNSIPLSAIERVEILKDGASALYGSDAIAGVINFILKKDVTETTISARYDKPDNTSSSSFSITTGFGDLSSDGFNVMLAYSRDEKDQLKASDRDFAKTGFLLFEHAGQDLVAYAGSANAIPGNAYITYNSRDENGDLVIKDGKNVTKSLSLNPYKEINGSCHENSAPSGNACQFDYTSTLFIQPESVRDNVFIQGLLEVNDTTEAYATLSWSRFDQINRIAPYPTGTLPFELTDQVIIDNVLPHVPANILADATKVSARWRVLPGGNRTTQWLTDTTHFVAGLRGDLNDISYDLSVTKSKATREENRLTGFPLTTEFMALATSGAVNIFADPAELSDEQNQAVADTMYNGNWETTDTSMTAIEGTASTDLFELAGGTSYIATGFDYRTSSYERTLSPANAAGGVILFESAGDAFDLERSTYGAFVEFLAPLFEGFELTAALRYDNVGGVTDSMRTGDTKVNDSANDTTYKLSAAYRPSDEWLIRASMGTGFKAPSMRQIGEPRIEFGVTSVPYDCPAGLDPALAQYCYSDKLQYDVYREGYAGLKPETSEQMTLGFVWADDSGNSFSLDYWSVDMEDQVDRVTQNQIFFNPDVYADLFTTRIDNATGDTVLAVIQAPINIGKSHNSGLDYQWNMSNETGFGTLKTQISGTYMIESETLQVGSEDVYETSMGQVGPNEAVTFRNIININNTLESGDLTHSLNFRIRSGYQDAAADVSFTVAQASDWNDTVDGSVILLEVPAHMLVDYRGTYAMDNGVDLSFGVKNLMDKQPPLTLNGAAGHQVGYDTRYHDPYGRTFYVQASYTF